MLHSLELSTKNEHLVRLIIQGKDVLLYTKIQKKYICISLYTNHIQHMVGNKKCCKIEEVVQYNGNMGEWTPCHRLKYLDH